MTKSDIKARLVDLVVKTTAAAQQRKNAPIVVLNEEEQAILNWIQTQRCNDAKDVVAGAFQFLGHPAVTEAYNRAKAESGFSLERFMAFTKPENPLPLLAHAQYHRGSYYCCEIRTGMDLRDHSNACEWKESYSLATEEQIRKAFDTVDTDKLVTSIFGADDRLIAAVVVDPLPSVAPAAAVSAN